MNIHLKKKRVKNWVSKFRNVDQSVLYLIRCLSTVVRNNVLQNERKDKKFEKLILKKISENGCASVP